MQQADWKSADEIAEAIMNGEATYQLIVDLWSRVGELENQVASLQAKLEANGDPMTAGSVRVAQGRRWRSASNQEPLA
jgi:CheY-specific phosphatase CheX